MDSLAEASLRPTADVRVRVVDGLAVMLDLRAGEYVVLDRVATAMWRALVTTAPEQRVAALAGAFDAPAERLSSDLEAFARQCVERGLLSRNAAAEDAPPVRERARTDLLTLRAWWSLFATTRWLARRGFAATYRAYARLPRPRAGGAGADGEALRERAERAFARAEHAFVLPSAPKDCLPRSLALYRFLLGCGVPAEHNIGVVRYPFEAHAWVESGGRVLFDSEEYVRSYAELARM